MVRGGTTLRQTLTVIPLTLSFTSVNLVKILNVIGIPSKSSWLIYVEEPNLICLGGKYFKSVQQLSTHMWYLTQWM